MYWYDNSEIIELLIKANGESIIKECLKKEIQFFISSSSILENKAINSHLNYFIEMRVSDSISILTEWIKNQKDIPPKKLANIIKTQSKESLDVNLFL